MSASAPVNTSEAFQLPSFLSRVRIKAGPVPRSLANVSAEGVLWQVTDRRFLLHIPDVAGYLVEDGQAITIDCRSGADEDTVNRFLCMAPLAALLYQRNTLALHSAVVADSRGAVLLAGDSASGKSTLLAVLLQRGWMMLSDELAAITHADGDWWVWPTTPRIRLWHDAAEKLDAKKIGPVRKDGAWQTICAISNFTDKPQPLRGIYWLTVHNREYIDINALEALEKFRAIGILSYNSHIADALFDRHEYLRTAGELANCIPVRHLRRPRGRWSAYELAHQVEAE